MRVWVRLAEYQAWFEENNFEYSYDICPDNECECYIDNEPSKEILHGERVGYVDCAWVMQNCKHIGELFDGYTRCDWTPVRFISLTEYDNSSFEPV